jgi:sarcosine oxidase
MRLADFRGGEREHEPQPRHPRPPAEHQRLDPEMSEYDAIVVGCGSMGSAALFHLASRGCRVLGLEQFDVPNDLGSSAGTNRIIRLAYAEDSRYVPLLRRAYELWRALEIEAQESLLFITGGIDAGPEHGSIVTGSLRSCEEHGLPHEVLDAAAIGARFPGYRLSPDMLAVFQPDGGFVMSERCIVAHVAAALARGAEVHGREAAVEWHPDDDGRRVQVRTDRGTYSARALVVTCGPWSSRFVPSLARLARPQRQVLLWAQPKTPSLFSTDRFPVFNMESPEGRFYGFPVHSIPGFKIGKYYHRHQWVDAEAVDRTCDAEDEAVLREGLRRYFPEADGPTLAMKVCMFTNSPDEQFIIDRHPEHPAVVVAAGFSGHGFKFSSVVGEILADLAVEGGTHWDLSLFRWNRAALASRERPDSA